MDTVVSCEHCDGDRLRHGRWAQVVHAAQAGPEVFEDTERAWGFGEHRLTRVGGCHGFTGRRCDRREGLAQQGHGFSFWKATVAQGSIMDYRRLAEYPATVRPGPCVAWHRERPQIARAALIPRSGSPGHEPCAW